MNSAHFVTFCDTRYYNPPSMPRSIKWFLSPVYFLDKTFCAFLISDMRATFFTNPIFCPHLLPWRWTTVSSKIITKFLPNKIITIICDLSDRGIDVSEVPAAFNLGVKDTPNVKAERTGTSGQSWTRSWSSESHTSQLVTCNICWNKGLVCDFN
jgi:hypothetical protein